MALYTFTLEKFHIDNTRSRHEDTDEATFGLQVGSQQFPVQSFSAGDVNNGDHIVNSSFSSVFISDNISPVGFSYLIYNGDASKLSVALTTLSQTILSQIIDDTIKWSGTEDIGFPNLSSGEAGADVPNPDDPFEDTSDWSSAFEEAILVDIGSFLFPDCDGFVAADARGMTKSRWDTLIDSAGGMTIRKTLRYPGTRSPAGCGSNSDYSVTWSVTREKISGPRPFSLKQFLQDHQVTLHPGIRSLDPTAPSISLKSLMSLA